MTAGQWPDASGRQYSRKAAPRLAEKEDAMALAESEIGALLDSRSEAIRAKDIERLLSHYSHDIVYFDVVPPLRYTGSASLRGRFSDWFERWKGPIVQELRDVNIRVSGDLATAHMLIRSGGTLTDGREVGFWVRTTDCCQRSKNGWLITHEHVSLPVDLESQTVALGLEP
jgi:ketosteroid isomerase-like protein